MKLVLIIPLTSAMLPTKLKLVLTDNLSWGLEFFRSCLIENLELDNFYHT